MSSNNDIAISETSHTREQWSKLSTLRSCLEHKPCVLIHLLSLPLLRYGKVKILHQEGTRKYLQRKLEQLERLRSEDTPRRLMITHTIGSQVKKIIDLELKTLQSRHDFQSQGQMTLKI